MLFISQTPTSPSTNNANKYIPGTAGFANQPSTRNRCTPDDRHLKYTNLYGGKSNMTSTTYTYN